MRDVNLVGDDEPAVRHRVESHVEVLAVDHSFPGLPSGGPMLRSLDSPSLTTSSVMGLVTPSMVRSPVVRFEKVR